MTKYDSNFKSKLFKAAWKIYRKAEQTFSFALKKAWDWAKKTLLGDNAQQQPRLWMPKEDFGRLYVGENFIQFKIVERNATSSYERHRQCKGERYFNCFYKVVGEILEPLQLLSKCDIFDSNFDFVLSKY